MLNVYEEVMQVIDEKKMSENGVYLTYYESIEVLAEDLGLEVGNVEFAESFNDKFNISVDELEGTDFITFDTAGSVDGIIFDNKEDSFDEIIHFLLSEKSYSKYVERDKVK